MSVHHIKAMVPSRSKPEIGRATKTQSSCTPWVHISNRGSKEVSNFNQMYIWCHRLSSGTNWPNQNWATQGLGAGLAIQHSPWIYQGRAGSRAQGWYLPNLCRPPGFHSQHHKKNKHQTSCLSGLRLCHLGKSRRRLAKSLTSFIQGNKVPAPWVNLSAGVFLFALGLLWSSSLQHIRTFTESWSCDCK